MSTLAIVLGVGFLAGVLTFSNGLSSTFDSIIKGSTPQGLVRAEGAASFGSGLSFSSDTLTPDDVAAQSQVPEVAQADGWVEGNGMFVVAKDGDLVGGQGAPSIAFNYTDTPSIVGESTLELIDGDWPSSPSEIALDEAAMEASGYSIGDEVEVILPAAESISDSGAQLTLSGVAEFNGGGTAGATLLILSTQGAQDIFLGGQDAFTSIALTPVEGVSQSDLAAAAGDAAPSGFEALTGDAVAEESQEAVGQFLDVISTFLIVFAVIAIVVGGFIIANTFTILVAQRVRELALLRALGASRRQVRRSVLLEAALMGLIGSTVGIFLGLGLSRALAALFTNFGLDIQSDSLVLTLNTVVAAYLVGLLVTMISAYIPARRAAKVAPVAAMRADGGGPTEKSLRRRAIIGFVVIGIGAALALVGLTGGPGNDALWIGGAALLWILTAALLSPVLGHPVLVACRVAFTKIFGATGRLAGENALRNPRRTGATAAALMIGLALVSAVGTLAASMSATTDEIVEEEFLADYVVQSVSFQAFPTSIGKEISGVSGVKSVSAEQFAEITVDGSETFATAVDDAYTDFYDFTMTQGTTAMNGLQAIVSQDWATDAGVELSESVPVSLAGGRAPEVEVEIVGVFEASEVSGDVLITRAVLAEFGVDALDNTVNINMRNGADAARVQSDLEGVVADLPIVQVLSTVEFAESLKSQINQLLFMIYGLLALAIVIAVIGIVNTLGLSVIERTREIGLLRAVGLSRARLRRMIALESVTISIMGALLGLTIGLIIGVLLRESLSENLTVLSLPWGSLLAFFVVAVLFGVLAAVIPAIRASRLKVLDAIATE
ncbi:MAG: FtsX-like permease family protein [Ornithinimicrobium sp.]